MSLDKNADKVADIAREKKKWEIFEEYQCGKTNYRRLAADFDCSVAQVGILINECLDELAVERKARGLKVVESELERLDFLLEYWRPKVKERTDDDKSEITPRDTTASDMILKIMARRARYLGLDAPEKKEVTGTLSLADALSSTIKRD